ncbi:MAG: carboxypeptidase regulatory-like domain-containing protein, partial [Longimicrobiales bacterium]
MNESAVWGVAGTGLVLALVACLVSPAAAQETGTETRQTVTGQLSVQGGGPLEGAMVALVTPQGESLAQVLTNGSGRFELTVFEPGEYRVRADRIGHASTFSEFFVLGPGEERSVDMTARVEAVQLVGIDVEGDRRCRVRPEEGLAVTQVWDEARKALAAAAWTQERGVYRYEMMELDRSLDRDGRRVLSESREHRGGYSRAPYRAVSEAQLVEEGFANLGRQESLYYAPDAEVLLSDIFLDTHCFQLESGEGEAAGLIGLAFEPTPDRRLPEIKGTLWTDPETAQLRWLDFIYTQLGIPVELSTALVGGRVEFSPLANGTWIVNSWRIRMPRAGSTINPTTQRRQAYLDGYTEQGGDVVRVHGNTGVVMEAESGARISGAVFDSLRTGGLSGARVFIEGTGHETTTAYDGSFVLGGLEPGLYSVGFSHPYLDELSHRPEPFDVEVEADATAQISFLAPPKRRLIESLCQGVERPNENGFVPGDGAHPADGVLVGRVTDEEGNPVAGATVRVLWREWKITYQPDGPSREDSVQEGRLGTTATTNESGHYRACWIPPDVPLEVAALVDMSDLDTGRQDAFWEPSDVFRARRELFRIPSETP